MKRILTSLILLSLSLFSFEELNIENFDEKIKNKNVIVDFYAVWCPPCKVLAQNLVDFSEIKPQNIEIFKVNVDEQMNLAKKYGVSALPTLLFFKDGQVVSKEVGILTPNELLEASEKRFK